MICRGESCDFTLDQGGIDTTDTRWLAGTVHVGNRSLLMVVHRDKAIDDTATKNLGKLDEGVAYPEGSQPWEVRVPTSLVLLQNLEEVPGIRDALTGNVVAITE